MDITEINRVLEPQGLAIFESRGEGGNQLQIQSDDALAIFSNDFEAWSFLADKIREGSEVHIEALKAVHESERKDIVNLNDLQGVSNF